MKRFCPRCGKEDVDFYQGFCIDCYVEMHDLVEVPKKIVIDKCPRCGKLTFKGKNYEFSEESLAKIVKSQVKSKLSNPVVEVSFEDNSALVTVSGFIDPKNQFRVSLKKKTRIEYHRRVCGVCSKLAGKYYEAKLQLRHSQEPDFHKFFKAVAFVKRKVRKKSRSKDEARMFWFKELKEGIDFFFGDKKIAKEIVDETASKFNTSYTKSSKLVGLTKDGKKKTRTTYCIRV